MAVSRFFILQRSKELREGELPSFRGYKEAAKAKLDKEYGWLESEKQKLKGLYIILKLNRKLIKSFLKLILFDHSSIIPLAKEIHECLSKFKSSFIFLSPIDCVFMILNIGSTLGTALSSKQYLQLKSLLFSSII